MRKGVKDINTENDPTSDTYKTQTSNYKDYVSTLGTSTTHQDLLNKSDDVQKKRLKMDADISLLNSIKNISNNNDTRILYNAHFYINILWMTLATTLIYYIFTQI